MKQRKFSLKTLTDLFIEKENSTPHTHIVAYVAEYVCYICYNICMERTLLFLDKQVCQKFALNTSFFNDVRP